MKNILLFALVFVSLLTASGCSSSKFEIASQDRDVEIGVLFRKEFTHDVCEKRRYRHIQVLLDGNEIMGYNLGITPTPAFLIYALTYIKGEVRNYNDLVGLRQHYISVEAAQNAEHDGETGLKIVTDLVRIRVTREQADKLRQGWYELKRNPPDFKLLGHNCATRLNDIFAQAGILPAGLPGVDKPEKVLQAIEKYYPDMTIKRGYFGINANREVTMVPLDESCDK